MCHQKFAYRPNNSNDTDHGINSLIHHIHVWGVVSLLAVDGYFRYDVAYAMARSFV